MSEERVCGPGCRGCIYLSAIATCDYFLIAGRCRASMGVKIRPGGGCRLKKKGERETHGALPNSLPRRKQLKKQTEKKEDGRKRKRSRLDRPEVMEMYEKGASDREIGERFGVRRSSVKKWRDSRGLEANFTRGGAPVRKENGHEDT